MAGAASNDQALSLLATVNNHGDLAVKLLSLKQAKDLLLPLEPPRALCGCRALPLLGRAPVLPRNPRPLVSSLVLPIFARLVSLQLEKFQTALARLLQGSAHTGPALTPAEVLVSIHGIVPEKDGLALKKIADACSACFEQRTVFTQVLAKALNQMVDQTHLPLLFMRTIIQAIDDFPSLVDFVMEILSKLVRKQVWRMPNLWFGFLKCASQTQPHSFHVLLQLPPPQLESALNKYANLRGPLAAYASQPSVKASLHRPKLANLGLENETHL